MVTVIVVLSGKGGVGKSTVSVQLALGFQRAGFKVGLLDVDLCGPSIPRMLNLENHDVHECSEGWVPVYTDASQTLGVMSIGFLLPNRDSAVIWRGPKKTSMIKNFLKDVYWNDINYLIIDTPPGTSDEHITVMENIKGMPSVGAILVTTPQLVAVDDVRRELTFCIKTKIPVLGIIENMSGFVCPHCDECTNLFSKGGGEGLAEMSNIPFLGSIPVDPNLATCMENGTDFALKFQTSPVKDVVQNIVDSIVKS